MPRIAILGAGISGLAIGWFLRQLLGSNAQLTIIEKSQRPGGWIKTVEKEGFLFEQGPRSCRTTGAGKDTLALVEALGLTEEVIAPCPDASNRYIYHGQHLRKLPKHLWELPFNSLTTGWLKALWTDWKASKRKENDESIEQFFSRRLGNSWVNLFIDPFVSGIYAGDCSRLSLKSCFPLFDEWEQQQGSLLRGALSHRSVSLPTNTFIEKMSRFPMFSFQEGMETLPRALANYLKDCLLSGQKVKGLKFEGREVDIELSGGNRLSVDHVISTLPTFVLGTLLKDDPLLSKRMETLSYATVMSINVGFRESVLPYKGFGYLIPSLYKLPILGCVWDSSVFPQQNRGNQTRLTLMMGGTHHPEVEHMSPLDLTAQTQIVLRDHLGICSEPQVIEMNKAVRAIPQFEVGHAEWKKNMEEIVDQEFPLLTLSGSAWTGVSINDCIAQGRKLAQRIADQYL